MSKEMKDSGIDWIQYLPKAWTVKRIKYVAESKSGKEIRKENILDDGEFKVFGGGEQIGFIDKSNTQKEDILVGRVGSCGKVTVPDEKVWATDNAIVLSSTDCNYKYLAYCLKSMPLDNLIKQTAQPLLTASSLMNCYIPLPMLNEQNQIVYYLNSKCEVIDQAIQKQKDIVNKLMEYKQSTITQAVTKGLNPNVEMKNVSMDFTDSIPQKWECSRLKYHCRITNGSDPETEGNIPVYGSGSEIVKYCGEFKNGPAILIGRKGTLDKPKLVEGKYWNVDTAMDLHPYSHMNPKYLYYVISCFTIDKYSTCTAKPSMTQGDYYNILIPVPSVLEQNEIVEYIDSKCDSINESIERSNKIIQKLEEYKKSLIYNAVTGKIDCRGEVK